MLVRVIFAYFEETQGIAGASTIDHCNHVGTPHHVSCVERFLRIMLEPIQR